jgi:alanine dehydrogenase
VGVDRAPPVTILLSDEAVRQATDMPLLVDFLEAALRAEAVGGGMLLPPRVTLNHAEGFLRVMPVVMPAAGVLGLKMFHGSLERGVRYVVVVCDLHSGEVKAVVDAAYLTAARTGATSGVATRSLARAESARVGLIGSGLEAETNLLAVCAVRPITHVRVHSRNAERRTAFAARMARALAIDVVPCATPQDAVAGADVVVVATNSGLGGGVAYCGEWAEPGQHIVSIGSTAPLLREIDVATFAAADVAVFDADLEQMREESGDVAALYAEAPPWPGPTALVDLLMGTAAGRHDPAQITLFKSVGTAAQDLAAAQCIAGERARAPPNAPRRPAISRTIGGRLRATSRAAFSGRVKLCTPARASNAVADGTASGRQWSSRTARAPAGSSSCIAVIICTPAMPSIAAWWTFKTMPKPPSGRPSTASRPSTTVISHGGLVRSNGRECSRPTWVQNWRQFPGRGNAR